MRMGINCFVREVCPWIRRFRAFILPAVVIFLVMHGAEALIAYDCAHPQLSGSYSLLAVNQCRESNPDLVTESYEEVFLYEAPKIQEINVRLAK